MKYLFYVLIVLILLVFSYFVIAGSNLYPLAGINGSYIWAGDYYGRLSGFEFFMQKSSEEFEEETMRRLILTSLLADKLIELELKERVVNSNQANERVDAVLRNDEKNIEQTAHGLYGWSVEDFQKFALLPQARQDILTEILGKEGVNFNEWLLQEFAEADVKIYFLPYKWINGELVDR